MKHHSVITRRTRTNTGGAARHFLIENTAGNSAMPDLKHPKNITDSLSIDSLIASIINRRAATRLIRDDITASINVPGRLGFGKTISVDLMDITSKGVMISTDQKLALNKKLILTLQFKSGKAFVIKAVVARHSDSSLNGYGIKFDNYNNELGDYMLETQKKLIFK